MVRRVVDLSGMAANGPTSLGHQVLRAPGGGARFRLPTNVIYSALREVVAVLTWFAAHWMAGPHGAGVPNIRTPADKLLDNGGDGNDFTESGADGTEQILCG
jgi:hypothetical protein